jgi:hypothetical protein
MKRLALCAALFASTALTAPAVAQQNQPVFATGVLTPGHALVLQQAGTPGSAVTRDAGPALAGNFTELGITNDGLPLCVRDKAAQHLFCVGANVGGSGMISYNPIGSGAPQNLVINVNGTNNQFPPPAGGSIVGISDARTFGADPTGLTDSTAAINSCLTAVGAMGTCYVGGGRFKILGNISIPGNTTLKCGFAFADVEDVNMSLFGTMPALMLDSGHTITAAGQSAWVANCLVVRNGMTFPAPNSSAYAGLALSDGGSGGFTVTDTEILGFDTAVYTTAARPYLQRVYADGTGVTKAVVELDNGGGDIGYVYAVKIQPIATGNFGGSVSCTAARRPGTGMRLNGIYYLGDIIVQNFAVDQIEVQNYQIGGNLWSDDISASCGFGTNVGVDLTENGALFNASLNLNGTQTGLLARTGGLPSYLPNVFMTYIGQDGVQMALGNVTIGLLSTNTFTVPPPPVPIIGRYAIFTSDGSGATHLTIQHAFLTQTHGGTAPYIFSASTNNVLGEQLVIDKLRTDLGGTNPFSGFVAGPGADPMLSEILAGSGGCTGLGSGSCALVAGSTTTRGGVVMSPTGTPGTVGTANIVLPVPAQVSYICTAVFNAQPTSWPGTPLLQVAQTGPTNLDLNWNSAIVAGSQYRIDYICRP